MILVVTLDEDLLAGESAKATVGGYHVSDPFLTAGQFYQRGTRVMIAKNPEEKWLVLRAESTPCI